MARGAYPLGQHDRRVTESSAGIHHALAFVHLKLGENGVTVLGESANEHVLVLDELGNEDLVPELDELGGRLDGGLGHDGHLPSR
jgi:hypothetical protein